MYNAIGFAVRQYRNMPTKIHSTAHRRPANVYLREWIDFRGLNQEQVAGRLDTSKSVVSKLVSGKQRYTQVWLERFAWALDCEVWQLYHPPEAPTADELLRDMEPEVRETAMKVLVDLSRHRKTGTDG